VWCDEPPRAARRPAHHASMLTRRKFAQAAAAAGAVLAFGKGSAAAPAWRERRDLYLQGVASGDPAPDSVLLWTRRQPAGGDSARGLSTQRGTRERSGVPQQEMPGLVLVWSSRRLRR